MKAILKLHKDMPRQGPGDNESTKRALGYLNLGNKEVSILDIGCGPGMQTIELAKNIKGKIIALDLFKSFLNELMESAKCENVHENIKTMEGSMFELDKYFKENSFDVVWIEGAIYIMGFGNGLKSIRPLLKENGYLVVSEMTWLKEDIPEELKSFWNLAYPTMQGFEGIKFTLKNNGYDLINSFKIPESSWWNNYYNPLKERCDKFKLECSDDKELMALIKEHEFEMDLYRKYSDYYGYVFYIMKKTNNN